MASNPRDAIYASAGKNGVEQFAAIVDLAATGLPPGRSKVTFPPCAGTTFCDAHLSVNHSLQGIHHCGC